jgi:hypothetical protein
VKAGDRAGRQQGPDAVAGSNEYLSMIKEHDDVGFPAGYGTSSCVAVLKLFANAPPHYKKSTQQDAWDC